jgi:hypothetical protein
MEPQISEKFKAEARHIVKRNWKCTNSYGLPTNKAGGDIK